MKSLAGSACSVHVDRKWMKVHKCKRTWCYTIQWWSRNSVHGWDVLFLEKMESAASNHEWPSLKVRLVQKRPYNLCTDVPIGRTSGSNYIGTKFVLYIIATRLHVLQKRVYSLYGTSLLCTFTDELFAWVRDQL